MSGSHFASWRIAGFPSVDASRIAVTGRRSPCRYFASQVTIWESEPAMLRSANRRALSTSPSSFAFAAPRATALKGTGVDTVQKIAVAVLQHFFGDDATIAATSVTWPLLGITRSWKTFSDLSKEVTDARVWGGIHTRTADEHADQLGRKVADYAIAKLK